MRYISLPDDNQRRLVFYLAMEEYVADVLGEGFFLWQVPPTVIFGRNQDMEAEVNLPYCREHGIQYYRRKSGGGCVYSDYGNVMISYVVPSGGVRDVFKEYLDMLCSALAGLGMNAVSSSNNDVLVGDRKVSGNAFFVHPSASIVHGTLLYDADFNELSKAITPSREKLESHGVKSVRQRVANLKDLGIGVDIRGLKASLKAAFTDSEYVLCPSDIVAIEKIEATYLDPAFIVGKNR